MKKRCCIVGAAPINNYDYIRSYLTDDDYFIFCDAGLKHRQGLGVQPDLIIGDFDSYEKEDFPQETIVLPHVKDDTDTFFAVKEGLLRGFEEFILLGCIGLRMDHTLGNLSALLYLHNHGAEAIAIDNHSEIEIVHNKPLKISDKFPYFSLLAINGPAKGVKIQNALYELSDATITLDFPLGVSNEPLKGKESIVSVREGMLLLIRVFDS